MSQSPANLVIRPEKIGELVIATPVFRAMKTSFPDEPLHVLTDEASAEVIRSDPCVDRIVKIQWRGARRGQRAAWRSIYDTLKQYSYSRAAILYPNCEGWNLLCAALRIPRVAQLGGTVLSYVFGHKRVLRRGYRVPRPFSDYYLDVARELGAGAPDTLPRLFVTNDETAAVRKQFPDFAAASPRIVVHPFGLTARFNYTVDAYKRLAGQLSAVLRCRVFFLGTPAEAASLGETDPARVNTCFMKGIPLRTAMGILGSADLVIGGSSGIIHIAAALGVPTLGIYCSTHNHQVVWGPRGPRARCIAASAETCGELHKGVHVCADKRFCDLSAFIPVEQVLSTACDILAENGASGANSRRTE